MPELTQTERHFVTNDTGAGMRLDRWLAMQNSDLSRSRIRQLIDQGCVKIVGDKSVSASTTLKQGQSVSMVIPAPIDTELKAQSIALDIVFEDEHLIVVNKPAGLVVHPAAGNPDNTLVNALLAHCGESLRGIGGELRPGIVHRLDKGTSGLLVAAKTGDAHAKLAAQFSVHSIERVYDALVWGVPKLAKGTITGNIGRSTSDRKKMTIKQAGGKHAETAYETAEIFGQIASWVKCRLMTGRTHQIRVHMSSLGNAVIADPTYGANTSKFTKLLDQVVVAEIRAMSHQALHARVLGFKHPISSRKLRFEADPPGDFNQLVQVLRASTARKPPTKLARRRP